MRIGCLPKNRKKNNARDRGEAILENKNQNGGVSQGEERQNFRAGSHKEPEGTFYTVFREDATCHAEVNAIRIASKKLGTYDLSGCVIYTTTECCPMCFSAIRWSGISSIVYGTRIGDAAKAGFNELPVSVKSLKRLSGSRIKIYPGFLADECKKLFREWVELESKKPGIVSHRSPYFLKAKNK